MDKYATTITNFTSLLSSTKEEFELLLEQSNFPFRKQIALDSQAVSSSCSTPATADVIAKTLFFHYSHARNPNNFYDPILPSIIYTLHLASTPPPSSHPAAPPPPHLFSPALVPPTPCNAGASDRREERAGEGLSFNLPRRPRTRLPPSIPE